VLTWRAQGGAVLRLEDETERGRWVGLDIDVGEDKNKTRTRRGQEWTSRSLFWRLSFIHVHRRAVTTGGGHRWDVNVT